MFHSFRHLSPLLPLFATFFFFSYIFITYSETTYVGFGFLTFCGVLSEIDSGEASPEVGGDLLLISFVEVDTLSNGVNEPLDEFTGRDSCFSFRNTSTLGPSC